MLLFVGAVVALVLIVAQLALAQQDTLPAQPVNTTTQQDPTGGTQPAGDGQSQAADPSGQNSASQTQPAAGAGSALPDLMHLDQNHNLVIDCAASDQLAQVKAALANDPQLQGALGGVEELSRLCADSGFVPANSSGVNQPSSNATDPTQPQQSQGTSAPATNGGNNGTSPNATGSALPQQQGQLTTPTTTPSGVVPPGTVVSPLS